MAKKPAKPKSIDEKVTGFRAALNAARIKPGSAEDKAVAPVRDAANEPKMAAAIRAFGETVDAADGKDEPALKAAQNKLKRAMTRIKPRRGSK